MTKEQAITAIKQIVDAIVEVVDQTGPLGAPAGVIYAALSAHGMTLEQFQQFMAALVGAGRIRHDGQLYLGRTAKWRKENAG